MKKVRIGLLGCGTIGSEFCRLVKESASLYRQRDDLDLEITSIGVAAPSKSRSSCVPSDRIVKGWENVTASENVDIVVELIGGAGEAKKALYDALGRGRHVVTANKLLLASEGAELTKLASKNRCGLSFEASVGCGIPVIGSVVETLSANNFERMIGIVNGTTNFILSQMTNENLTYEQALSLAQDNGFAEADPSFDVAGNDASQKLAILAALAFGIEVSDDEIFTEGISNITRQDIDLVSAFGYVIKLLAIGHRTANGVELRVHPALVSKSHPLASVHDEFNAFFLSGDVTGEVMLYGKGAGPLPTAGAVLADVARLARMEQTGPARLNWSYNNVEHVPIGDTQTGYYMIFPVKNTPGVIGRITSTLGSYGINIASAHAHIPDPQNGKGIVQIISHKARELNLRSALDAVRDLPVLDGDARFYRIEIPT